MHQNWFLIIRGFGFFLGGVLKFCHMMILYTVNWNPSLFWAKRLYPSISWESRLRYRPLILLLKSSHWCIGLSTIRRGKTAWTDLLKLSAAPLLELCPKAHRRWQCQPYTYWSKGHFENSYAEPVCIIKDLQVWIKYKDVSSWCAHTVSIVWYLGFVPHRHNVTKLEYVTDCQSRVSWESHTVPEQLVTAKRQN